MPLTTNSLNQISNAGLLPPGSVANRINLIGNANYLRIKGDSISAFLPYFGERQLAGGYNNNNVGIQFNGIPKEYSVTKDEKKQQHNIRFNINNNTENFQVYITVFPNMTATMNINSSHRFAISYSGFVSSIEKELLE